MSLKLGAFEVRCDGPGCDRGFAFACWDAAGYMTREQFVDYLQRRGWTADGDEHLCPDCSMPAVGAAKSAACKGGGR